MVATTEKFACPACAALARGDMNRGLPIPAHENPADWIETHAFGALHAKIADGHYVIFPEVLDGNDLAAIDAGERPGQGWTVEISGDEPFGVFATVNEAKQAASEHAMAAYGTSEIGTLHPAWGVHQTVTRTVA